MHDENDPRCEFSGPQIPLKCPQARVNPSMSQEDPNLLNIRKSNSPYLGDTDSGFREYTPLSIEPGNLDMPSSPNPFILPTPSSPDLKTDEDYHRISL